MAKILTKTQQYHKLPDWVFNMLSDRFTNRGLAEGYVRTMNNAARERDLRIRFKIKVKSGKIPHTKLKRTEYVIVSRA